MSSFTTPLDVRKLDDGRTWMVLEPFTYHLGTEDSPDYITVPIGFVTDFASVPRGLWNLFPPTGKYGKAAVIHDFLYQNGGITWEYMIQPNDKSRPPRLITRRRQPTREEADRILFEAMATLKVHPVMKRLVYWGVRLGGHWAWARGHDSTGGV